MKPQSMGKSAISALMGQWGKYVIQLASLMVFSRLLLPQDFGLIAMVTAIIGIAWVVGDFGLSLAAIQAKSLSHGQKTRLFWANTAVGIGLSIVILLLAGPIAAFYGDPRLVPVTQAVAIVFALNGFSTQFRAEVNRSLRFRYLALSDVVSQTAAFGIALVLVLTTDLTYWALVIQQLSAAFIVAVMVAMGARWWPGLPKRGTEMGGLYSFGALTFLAQILTYITSNLDSVLIGKVNGAAVIGHYNRAYQVAAMPIQQLASPLTRVVLPYLSLHRTSQHEFSASLRKIQLVMSYALVGLLSLLAAATYPVVDIVLGANWGESVPMIRMLTIATAIQSLSYIYYWVMLSQAKTGLLLISELPGRLFMITAMIAVSPLGPLWVAGSLAVGQLVILASGAIYALPKIEINPRPILTASIRPFMLFAIAALVTVMIDAGMYSALPLVARLAADLATWAMFPAAALAVSAYRKDLRVLLNTATEIIKRKIA